MASRDATRDDEAGRVRCALVADLDAGFVELVRAYEGLVLTVAASGGPGAPVEAEDLAAEAFLRAYRALRSYPQDRVSELALRPWLVTIVLNVARNSRRQAARRPRTTALTDRDAATLLVGAEVSADHDGDDGVRRLVDRLPPLQRQAVVLRHVVGLSSAEIAGVLGCARGTAKSHVSRGMARLRRQWVAPEIGGDP